MNAVYLTTAGRIRRELREISLVVERVEQIWSLRKQAQSSKEQDYWIDAVALNLHGFYAGIERVLELIADKVDQTKPEGRVWYRELLQQMTADVPGARPAVLSLAVRDQLDRYRGFRHVVRNVYTFSLDAKQIELLVEQVPALHTQISTELEEFANFLEQLAQK